ncbi:DUF1893 domain-containing protein [Ructibacterium gallinarum]|uniref:DUF1893 domain-containing protein n=1 Tax=Ructibacterium gallinarum TaxID=2779355 RepID=A0A9D5M6N0_9FIRM|nr:DUF1893 domain-containing protein [Ructibacterium gallinarum]MBE5040487.1 DUF1893 domain-containing protein [Ructibacterium gallinarum]
MTELEAVRDILCSKSCTCVVKKEDVLKTSRERGIQPVLQWLEEDTDALKNGVVCDKVVGKAAALLFVYGGIRKIHAGVISSPAWSVLKEHGIFCTYDKMVSRIWNRDHTGLCPMESRALDMEDPDEAYRVFRKLVLGKEDDICNTEH